jgi:hypothetical protein
LIFFFSDREVGDRLRQFFLFEPGGVFGKGSGGAAIGQQKRRAQRLVLQVRKIFDEILLEELGGAAGVLDCELDERFRKDVREIGLGRDDKIRRLVLDHDDAADAVLDRGVFALGVNADVDGPGVSHRVVVVDRQVVDEEEFFFDGSLEKTEVDRGARAELGDVEFREALLEPVEPGELCVDGEAGVLVNAAIVFVKPESGGLERAGGQIAADVFVRDEIELGVGF